MKRKDIINSIEKAINRAVKVRDIYGQEWKGYLVRTYVVGGYAILPFDYMQPHLLLNYDEIVEISDLYNPKIETIKIN